MQRVKYYIDGLKDRKNKSKLVQKLDSIIGIKLIEIDEIHNTISFIFTSVWGLNLAEYYIKKWDDGKLQCCSSWSNLKPHNQVLCLPKGYSSLFTQ